MRVQVYRNLNRGCFSIRDKKTRKVLHHASTVVLTNCRFVVRPGGRKRTLETRQKHVHAWVEGDLYSFDDERSKRTAQLFDEIFQCPRAYYNPYKVDQFTELRSLQPVEEAETVVLDLERGVRFREYDARRAA